MIAKKRHPKNEVFAVSIRVWDPCPNSVFSARAWILDSHLNSRIRKSRMTKEKIIVPYKKNAI
jgi:hypothetical protein